MFSVEVKNKKPLGKHLKGKEKLLESKSPVFFPKKLEKIESEKKKKRTSVDKHEKIAKKSLLSFDLDNAEELF